MWNLRLREGKTSLHSHAARLLAEPGFKRRRIPHQPESFGVGVASAHTLPTLPPTFQTEFCLVGPCPSLWAASGPVWAGTPPGSRLRLHGDERRGGAAEREASFSPAGSSSAPWCPVSPTLIWWKSNEAHWAWRTWDLNFCFFSFHCFWKDLPSCRHPPQQESFWLAVEWKQWLWTEHLLWHFTHIVFKPLNNQWKVKKLLVAQLCPVDSSLPGSSVYGISQPRTLEWVAIPFSRGSSQPRDQTWVSCIAGGFFTVWATGKSQITCERGIIISILKIRKLSHKAIMSLSRSQCLSWRDIFSSLLGVVSNRTCHPGSSP